jgi:hypothetical protein
MKQAVELHKYCQGSATHNPLICPSIVREEFRPIPNEKNLTIFSLIFSAALFLFGMGGCNQMVNSKPE